MVEVLMGGLIGLFTTIVAVLLPLAIKGRRAARAQLAAQQVKDQLVSDVVLGDEARGMPSLIERDASLRSLVKESAAPALIKQALEDLHREIDAKFDRLNESVETHMGESLKTQQQVRDRLAELERDRAAAHIEAIEMWHAIGKVAEAPPPDKRGEAPI